VKPAIVESDSLRVELDSGVVDQGAQRTVGVVGDALHEQRDLGLVGDVESARLDIRPRWLDRLRPPLEWYFATHKLMAGGRSAQIA
jgi:hypothetical protein